MPKLESYRKQAKQILRWHQDGNYSVAGKVRLLGRYRDLTDREILDMKMSLTLAQDVVAAEAGFANWAALKHSIDNVAAAQGRDVPAPQLSKVTPILFVRDVTAAADFYIAKLGFAIDFLHGKPPFYGSVSRDGVCLHLRFVHAPTFAGLAARETSLILATIEVANVKALFTEFESRGVPFPQTLTRQAWGGLDFHVRDPDGNVISFVEFRQNADAST